MVSVRPSQKSATTDTMRENNNYLLAVACWVILNSLDLFNIFLKILKGQHHQELAVGTEICMRTNFAAEARAKDGVVVYPFDQ